MKKIVLSMAVLFALSFSMGAVAQDKKTDKKTEKTECQKQKKSDQCCSKEAGKKLQ